ncbi:MAG: 3-phosphoserine/phosphohydroxythreonine transaminase [Betaproteobacteria bacterium]|nr:3-phosphoserine/phosphohydroxythreonine transaminase [Betaproteobacteria bacterium]
MSARPYNFSAGPAAIPEEVLQQAAAEMLDWQGSGMSVMEMSHRGPQFGRIIAQAETDFRELLGISADYHVLFMQGGALAENAIVPLNLSRGAKADYVVTGSWSQKSQLEARKYCDVQLVINAHETANYSTIPAFSHWTPRADAQYLHYCANETIDGVEFHDLPSQFSLPLVADMSSSILSRPIDVGAHACIYAGAQKNIGPAGLTLVIVHREMLGHALPVCPSAFDYTVVAKNNSMYNTPPTYAIYIAGLVFQWLKRQAEEGFTGIAAIAERNRKKADLLYGCIDKSALFANRVNPACRSRMNVPFFLRDERLNEPFLQGAAERGLLQLKGHKSVGGMRASIYNAMPLSGVQALVAYMHEFERSH